jgi:hypothetical protein
MGSKYTVVISLPQLIEDFIFITKPNMPQPKKKYKKKIVQQKKTKH